MRHLLAGTAMLLALGAGPVFAANVTGLYAGIYAGASLRNDASFGYDYFGAILTDTGTIETPSSFLNNGVDPDLFEELNLGLVEYPFVDATPGPGAAGADLSDGLLAFNPSMAGGIVLGYGFGNGFRIEADVSAMSFSSGIYTEQTATGVDIDGAIDGAGVWTWTNAASGALPLFPPGPLEDDGFSYRTDLQFLLLGGYYDFDTGGSLTPYLGAGGGIARVTATMTDMCVCGDESFSASTIVPAAELGGGIRIAVSDPVTLDIGYRYRLAGSPGLSVYEFSDASAGPGFPGFVGIGMHQSGLIGVHTLQAGLSFALN